MTPDGTPIQLSSGDRPEAPPPPAGQRRPPEFGLAALTVGLGGFACLGLWSLLTQNKMELPERLANLTPGILFFAMILAGSCFVFASSAKSEDFRPMRFVSSLILLIAGLIPTAWCLALLLHGLGMLLS